MNCCNLEQPEPVETPQEKKPSLPALTAFNIDVTDLYSEWKHWVSAH